MDVGGTYIAETALGSAERHNLPNVRLRAGVVQTPAGPYFIKLTGPARTVAAQAQAFPTDSSPACRTRGNVAITGRYGLKVIATLRITGTATPFTRVGAYSHCSTASSAA